MNGTQMMFRAERNPLELGYESFSFRFLMSAMRGAIARQPRPERVDPRHGGRRVPRITNERPRARHAVVAAVRWTGTKTGTKATARSGS